VRSPVSALFTQAPGDFARAYPVVLSGLAAATDCGMAGGRVARLLLPATGTRVPGVGRLGGDRFMQVPSFNPLTEADRMAPSKRIPRQQQQAQAIVAPDTVDTSAAETSAAETSAASDTADAAASAAEVPRYTAIAETAYYKAEQRGFEPGNDQQDWFEAEREHDVHKQQGGT